MSLREIAGLTLLMIAVVMMPFGYWLSFKWFLAALAFALPGAFLFFSARVLRQKMQHDDFLDIPLSKDMKGFHGAKLFDGLEHDDD